ncbi:hypothetical protein BGZ94_010079 [Podila epigama]|nr:hypothetical protein BGZ94_010079 [Podila epigama]
MSGVHVLRHNDLTVKAATNPASALYLSTPRSQQQGALNCRNLGEKLVLERGSSVTPQDLPRILYDITQVAGQGPQSTYVWVNNNCEAYNIRTRTLEILDCRTTLPTLCTNKAKNTKIEVNTKAGPLQGTRDPNSFRFLGIPYAKAPVGNLRFRPPEPAASWKKPLVATRFKPVCPQERGTDSKLNRAPESEDCLFLNVFTPSVKDIQAESRLPVMVYFHGGGNKQYGGSSVYFEPGNLVSRGRVVVVTFNYRLGLLGTLENETAVPRTTLPGNLFLRDQILALQWVRDNIAAFGGDPNQVTLFGESAGAVSLRAMLVIPETFGLYKRVISQSDPIGLPFHKSSTSSGILGKSAMEALGCTDMKCLQSVPLEQILDAQEKALDHYYKVYIRSVPLIAFLPTIDHSFIKDDFYALAKAGKVNSEVQLVWGSVHDEIGTVMPSEPIPTEHYGPALLSYLRDERAEIIASSPYYQLDQSRPDTARETLARAATDLYFTCPRFRAADAIKASGKGPKMSFFRFNRGHHLGKPTDPSKMSTYFCQSTSTQPRVCHFDDVAPSFGSAMSIPGLARSADDARFSRQIIDRFTAFARSGSSNGGGGNGGSEKNRDATAVAWEAYDTQSRPVLELGLESFISYNSERDACTWMTSKNVF